MQEKINGLLVVPAQKYGEDLANPKVRLGEINVLLVVETSGIRLCAGVKRALSK
jgi:hypothetical protein